MKYFVVCPRGLEIPLYEELQEITTRYMDAQGLLEVGLPKADATTLAKSIESVFLGAPPIKSMGGIEVSGSFALAMAINLHSRIASRVLLQLIRCPYKNEEDIYKATRSLSWEDWFRVDQTIRVDVTAQRSNLQSLNFITLRIKDAVCDRFREIGGERPSIETATPDVRIMAFIDATHVSIYLDTSGEALFKRGWRDEKGAAPLKENLAAGILALTKWQASQPLYDPMCGSGTFLIEAAHIARHIPPGAIRAGLMEKLGPRDKGVNLVDAQQRARDQTFSHMPSNTISNEPTLNADEDVTLHSPALDPTQTSSLEHRENSLKPVWVAPIMVESGKVLDTNLPDPKLTHSKKKFVSTETASDSVEANTDSRHQKKSDWFSNASLMPLPFKPSRVDLVGIYQGFGFLRLKPFQASEEVTLWGFLKVAAQLEMQRYQEVPLLMAGSDINEQMIKVVQHNWQMARLPGLPNVRQVDALMAKAPLKNPALVTQIPGVMLFNPPYGERIDLKGVRGGRADSRSLDREFDSEGMDIDDINDDEDNSYERHREPERKMRGARDPLPKNFTDPAFIAFLAGFGRHLKEEFAGWQIDVLTADMGLPGQLRMKETKRTPLFNGSIECRLFRFEIRQFQKNTPVDVTSEE